MEHVHHICLHVYSGVSLAVLNGAQVCSHEISWVYILRCVALQCTAVKCLQTFVAISAHYLI